MKTSYLALFLCFSSSALSAELRPDLKGYASYFCDEVSKNLQDKSIPDAQIELAFVKTDRELKSVAQEFAETNHHRGFSFGICPDGRKYVVSTPAPANVLSTHDNQFEISTAALKACKSYEVAVIEDGKPFPKTLASDVTKVARKNLAVLSVSCTPADKTDAGPELWALLMPKFEHAPSQKSIADLLSWIDTNRRKLKLPELKRNPKLDKTAEEAAKFKTLEHPHTLLMSKKALLKNEGLHLLGENRAISSSFTGLAELFWNSPEHRSLLLNAKADAIGYALDEVHGQKLLVLVLAQIEP